MDLGVPLNITEYIEDKYFSRDPVRKVYLQIVADLKAAADNLAVLFNLHFTGLMRLQQGLYLVGYICTWVSGNLR